MFDIYHGTAPSYMLGLCKRCTDSRLRSTAYIRRLHCPEDIPALCRQILYCGRIKRVERTAIQIRPTHFSLHGHIL